MRPSLLQFHGNEDDALLRAASACRTSRPSRWARRGAGLGDRWTARYPGASAFLFDSHAQRRRRRQRPHLRLVAHPGTAWTSRSCWPAASFPTTCSTPSAAYVPWGVDVSSGIESAPGIKDGDTHARASSRKCGAPIRPLSSGSSPARRPEPRPQPGCQPRHARITAATVARTSTQRPSVVDESPRCQQAPGGDVFGHQRLRRDRHAKSRLAQLRAGSTGARSRCPGADASDAMPLSAAHVAPGLRSRCGVQQSAGRAAPPARADISRSWPSSRGLSTGPIRSGAARAPASPRATAPARSAGRHRARSAADPACPRWPQMQLEVGQLARQALQPRNHPARQHAARTAEHQRRLLRSPAQLRPGAAQRFERRLGRFVQAPAGGVSARPRPWRTNSAVPSASSSARSCRLTAPWVTCSSAAARLTLSRRARPRRRAGR